MNPETTDFSMPLFPLPVVLFPQMALPLHIFELRYREMIQLCLENQKPFGVILSQNNQMFNVGCSARIVKVVKQYPDGEFDILTQGHQRFVVKEYLSGKDYLQGKVHYFNDSEWIQSAEMRIRKTRLLEKILKSCRALHLRVEFTQGIEDIIQDDHCCISYQFLQQMGFDLLFQQKMLELRSEIQRLEHITEYLDKLLVLAEDTPKGMTLFGGNGKSSKQGIA